MNEYLSSLRASLTEVGFARSAADTIRTAAPELFASWHDFQASYDRLPLDDYMADLGRYRRRRYAVYHMSDQGQNRAQHQPHFQTANYNWLNGNVERWFQEIEAEVADSATLNAALKMCFDLFAPMRPQVQSWHTEVHQFRIEACAEKHGLPTPEGVHRDGVDFVLVLLVKRENIVAGTTTLHDPNGVKISEFTLTEPGDAVWIDDQRLFHGVTAVQPADPSKPAYRDVLVLTLKPIAGD